jgi:RNA polymerase sigma-70 factor (ECF subfamily)
MALRPGVGLDGWEIAVAKKLVGEYRRRSRILERYEFEDLVQDCLLHWITVRRSLDRDPANPPLGYMATVLRNWLADLVRKRGTDKRSGDLDTPSLDASIDGSDDGMTLAELLDVSQSRDSAGDGETHHHMHLDLLRACAHLTPAQQRLCLMLGEEGLSVKAAAEQLGIPRGTLYEEINRIRKLFADHGLEIYLRG